MYARLQHGFAIKAEQHAGAAWFPPTPGFVLVVLALASLGEVDDVKQPFSARDAHRTLIP